MIEYFTTVSPSHTPASHYFLITTATKIGQLATVSYSNNNEKLILNKNN